MFISSGLNPTAIFSLRATNRALANECLAY